MLASYLLRVVPAEAAEGHVVGELEVIASGEVHTVRSVADLVDVLRGAPLHTALFDIPTATDLPEALA